MELPARRRSEIASRAAELERQGKWDEAAALYREIYNRALGDGDLEGAARALIQGGSALSRQGCLQEAEHLAQQCIALAESNGLAGVSARAIALLGSIHFFRSDYAEAAELYARAQEIARILGDDLLVGSATQNLGIIANIRGHFRQARALYLESIGSSIRAENRGGAMQTYLNLGKACVCLEDWLEAEVYFERGIEIAEQIGDIPMRTRLYANLSIPLIRTGEFPRAAAALSTAAQLATRILDTDTLSHIARLRGMIARLQGRLAAAQAHLKEALRFATGPGSELARGEALEEKGRLCQAEGDLDEAHAAFNEARVCFLALGAQHDIARMDTLLSQCRAVARAPRNFGVYT